MEKNSTLKTSLKVLPFVLALSGCGTEPKKASETTPQLSTSSQALNSQCIYNASRVLQVMDSSGKKMQNAGSFPPLQRIGFCGTNKILMVGQGRQGFYDSSTGKVTFLSQQETIPNALACETDGNIGYVVDGANLIQIDLNTGSQIGKLKLGTRGIVQVQMLNVNGKKYPVVYGETHDFHLVTDFANGKYTSFNTNASGLGVGLFKIDSNGRFYQPIVKTLKDTKGEILTMTLNPTLDGFSSVQSTVSFSKTAYEVVEIDVNDSHDRLVLTEDGAIQVIELSTGKLLANITNIGSGKIIDGASSIDIDPISGNFMIGTISLVGVGRLPQSALFDKNGNFISLTDKSLSGDWVRGGGFGNCPPVSSGEKTGEVGPPEGENVLDGGTNDGMNDGGTQEGNGDKSVSEQNGGDNVQDGGVEGGTVDSAGEVNTERKGQDNNVNTENNNNEGTTDSNGGKEGQNTEQVGPVNALKCGVGEGKVLQGSPKLSCDKGVLLIEADNGDKVGTDDGAGKMGEVSFHCKTAVRRAVGPYLDTVSGDPKCKTIETHGSKISMRQRGIVLGPVGTEYDLAHYKEIFKDGAVVDIEFSVNLKQGKALQIGYFHPELNKTIWVSAYTVNEHGESRIMKESEVKQLALASLVDDKTPPKDTGCGGCDGTGNGNGGGNLPAWIVGILGAFGLDRKRKQGKQEAVK